MDTSLTASSTALDPRIASLLPKGDVFVDLGCGGGEALDALCGYYARSIGIDFSTTRLERRTAQARGWEFLRGDLNAALPLPSGYATAVLANQVIEHVIDPMHFLTEAHRILRPGGVMVLTTPNARQLRQLVRLVMLGRGLRTGNDDSTDGAWDNGHIHYFTHADVVDLLSACGFCSVRSRALIALHGEHALRRFLDRHSDAGLVREFVSGNALFVAAK